MKNISKKLTCASIILVLVLSITDVVRSQETPPPGLNAGPYQFNMGMMVGYRSINTDAYGANPSDYWAQQRYWETGNYRGNGILLKSFNLYGESTGDQGFFDQMMLNVDGLGDPFTTASLRMRSFNEYDLKVNYRNSKYMMNRNDSIYTGLHKFDDTREILNASLDVDASEDITLRASFNSIGRSGTMTTTVSPFIVGAEEEAGPGGTADGSFGTYARGNFYWMETPVNDATNEFSLSATLKSITNTDITLGGGYRTFSQEYLPVPINDTSLTYYPTKGTVNWAGVFAGFPNSPTNALNNPLHSYEYSDNQESKTPFGFLELVTRPIKDLSITATARYEDTKMDGTVYGNLNGIMPRRTGGGVRDIADTVNGVYENKLQTIFGSLSVAGSLTDEIALTGVYRITSTDLEVDGVIHENVGATDTAGTGIYKSLFTGPFDNIVSSKTTEHHIEGYANFVPMNMLNLRLGLQMNMRSPQYNRTVDGVADSIGNTNLSRETQGLTPYFSFWYRPMRSLKINGRYSHTSTNVYEHGTTNEVDMPVRIKPKSVDKYSIGVDIDPMQDLSVNLHYTGMSGGSDYLNMISTVQAYNPTLTDKDWSVGGSLRYQIISSTALLVSGDYRKSDRALPSSFTRGQLDPTPAYGDSLTIDVEQHTTSLYFDASITSNPIKQLRLLVGYSMIDAKGGSYITPDVKTSTSTTTYYPDLMQIGGPYSWSLLHAQVSYDITDNIGIQLDYQLASQKEQVTDAYSGISDDLLTDPNAQGSYEALYPAVVNSYKASMLVGNVYLRF